MAPTLPTQAPASAATSKIASTEFRLGDNDMSDASDSDQSQSNERSLSPSRQGMGKIRKKKERRQFGALAEELGDLLGSAFNPEDGTSAAVGVGEVQQATDDQVMDIESTFTGKKMNKRTRQNLQRMEARQKRDKMQVGSSEHNTRSKSTTTAERGGVTKKNKKLTPTEKRRAREKEARIRKAVDAMGEKMDIE
ncbi:hypothetical protein P153DRAFT_392630 [Dothidotthia symphoricarpi CBS 119687]|uniref:Uncharacterized protein n=1 Tax=Dothidotthia symphoricarpi CBS 119687 TaxID=1392245 RepID=A0A6A6AS74_9PLEO|nr:uncharacterized protein P153DRAFT_392630 [Dothidotthia symphoricarpi CBS 119687]KAF2134008.1 hypothetical protein P153DRAFT_392630 [Dothidotthia symphoricarpi CBS 119687]